MNLTNRKLKIIFGLISFVLLITLLLKLIDAPGGMFLPGYFLGIIVIIGIILSCLIIAGVMKIIFKRISFLALLFIATTILFSAFHYQLYSPTLKIIVPNGYRGEINLVLSKVKDNILTVDTNGIGYINELTFNKTYSRPIVEQLDGKNLDENLVGYNNSTFFGKSIGTRNEIKSLSFKIVSDDTSEEQFSTLNWLEKVDMKLVLLQDSNKLIGNKAIEVGTK